MSDFNWKKFLFGSISRKLGWAFGLLILLLILLVTITYVLNTQIQEDQKELREIEAPLELMVQQVIGYDAILTGEVYGALLHMEKNQYDDFLEHKNRYDEAGIKLDSLLKNESRLLLQKSKRSELNKKEVENYLSELDRINILLVDLETRAFEVLQKGNTEEAKQLIMTDSYSQFKFELAKLYNLWGEAEARISEEYRQRIFNESRIIELTNLGMGFIFIIVSLLVSFFVFRAINNPIKELFYATSELEKGNFNVRTNIHTGDELEDLGLTLNETIQLLGDLDKEKKEIDRAKTEFLSITSHELRSPMTPMKAQLQMLLGDYYGKLNEKQKNAMDIVLRNTERLDKIIVDFLEISRMEAGRLKFEFIKTSLNTPISNVIEEIKAFMPEKKIKIELKMGNLPVIEVDPDRVMQVLRNLLTNAVKFSKEDGKIEVEVGTKQKEIIFSVKDHGVGIPKENQTGIFEPFYQVDNMYQHKSGGTGLGLAICKGIIQSQGGKIWFDSVEGKGTSFYFTVPFEPTREIKPIRVLFSPKLDIEKKIKAIFLEILGPMGENEFEDIKQKGILEDSLIDYVSFLKKKGIIEHAEEFKNKIRLVFSGQKEPKKEDNKNKLDLSDLKKGGLIK